jgi:hypothetical protein
MQTFIFLLVMTSVTVIYDFNRNSDISQWNIVDDVVMGGRSNGSIFLNSEGYGVFKGTVSLKNSGGFSMVRHRLKPKTVDQHSSFVIRLKGDGKRYEFRVKSKTGEYYFYARPFDTSGEWEFIEIAFNSMYPTFRGNKLDLPNYPGETLAEIIFFIGNKKAEQFKLVIDRIEVK